MSAYYNEFDKNAAAWLRELIKAGHIADGEVDTRSIEDVRADDLLGFTQCHFFAGVGGWSLALRLAGWPDDRPVWTGSAPCQPFSAAGKGAGADDERHLWPVFYGLIDACRPPIIFGEQVASSVVVGRSQKAPRSGVRAGLQDASQGQRPDPTCKGESGEEGGRVRLGRTRREDSGTDRHGGLRGDRASTQSGWRKDLGQSELGQSEPICGLPLFKCQGGASCPERCDGGLGREHRYQDGEGDDETSERRLERILKAHWCEPEGPVEWAWIDVVRADLERARYAFGACDVPAAGVGAPHIRQRLYWCGVGQADTSGARLEGLNAGALGYERATTQRGGGVVRMAHADERAGRQGRADIRGRADRGDAQSRAGSGGDGMHDADGRGPVGGFWAGADWLPCRDNKWRPVEPGTFPLAHGLPARVGRLRGYGNAIVPAVAAAFVRSCNA